MGRGAEGSCPRGHLFSMLTSNPCDTIVPLQRRQPLEFTSTSFLDLALDARYRLVPSTACLAMSSGSSELRNQSDSLTESADLPSGVTPGHQGRVTASWPFLRRQPIPTHCLLTLALSNLSLRTPLHSSAFLRSPPALSSSPDRSR